MRRRNPSLFRRTGNLVRLVTAAAVVIAILYPDSKAGRMIYDLLGQVLATVRTLLDKVGKLTLADIVVAGATALRKSAERVSAMNEQAKKAAAEKKAHEEEEADPAPDEDDEELPENA